MAPSRRVFALAAVIALGTAACSQDSPEQELPCEYWVSQYQSGGVELDKVPSEFKQAVQGEEACDDVRARTEG